MTQQAREFGPQSTAAEVIDGIDLRGKFAIVTGGAAGLGLETVRALAGAGAHVTIAARNLPAAKQAADSLNREIGEDRIDAGRIDLGDLASVRAFAAEWGDKPLHILVNNAGIMACPLERTVDGFEMQLGTNHLGHFLLTNLLLPALIAAYGARVVSLTSVGHKRGAIDLEDPNFEERPYEPFLAYGQSKTANALFAVELDRRYRDAGIRAFAVMPGFIETDLARHMTPEYREKMGLNNNERTPFQFKSIPAGAATSVWAASAPELDDQGGLYLEDCAVAKPHSEEKRPGKGVMPHALDASDAQRLWTVSAEMVGLDEAVA
ncbi:SDR family NAD(P)-dependent oxidoreductase [Novosphingobium sp. 9U]|uniref:SDR family NAD(P)-dependent oxidoreductase n=1 Tax=Novosphingobium sp. 9U TaxID=2653158 RepID=UPI0012EFE246|nr:SDR family NAD(P)-dependent oxidoreductase [Novosphingobium sp. 9U]VWX50582.1 putative oxidoreductase [Novosphingobium sp. 9U]